MATAPLAVSPNSGNVLLGRGKLYFDRFVTGTTTRQGEFDLGNIDTFELIPSAKVKDLYESMDPQSLLYKRAVTQQEVKIKIQGDEFSLFNLATVLMGDQSQFTQTTGTATAASVTAAPLNGAWYPTGYRNISVTDVKQGTTAGVLGTDYNVDATTGRIQVFTTGAFTAGTAVTWDGSYAATTINTVQGSTVGSVEGFLRFVGNPVAGPKFEVQIWHANFTPAGNLGLIADKFGDWQLDGICIADLVNNPTQPFYEMLQIG